ncbi:AAA family ATPase [Rhizosphaericola mali]|uniref:ATP-binding protein n=1 Tax=Rhizosphaericola mali TaxID=2545455 RepID=A0A5P2G3T4_9BACT|nr:ATP-binding protein [Rhizosphaericola mali]QES88482.1 ATP-binding protein [Rhizosphaericola mali]
MALKKIVIIGPESTGKSTLSADLAIHFDTNWCEEYAREYLVKFGKEYTIETLTDIAKGQIKLEENAIEQAIKENKEFVFIDTDMYVMKVWSEYVFGTCDNYILEQINHRKYDFYLLANTDLPWAADELREYPDENPRLELFQIYKDILINQSTPWAEIKGTGEERTKMAIDIIEKYFQK